MENTLSDKKAAHPLNESHLLEDFKVLLTRPRQFFEFFAEPSRIDRVVWAKVILIYLGLAALNSMISFSSVDSANWAFDVNGVDPRIARYAQTLLQNVGNVFHQVMVAVMPFAALLSSALFAIFCVFSLRLLGGSSNRLSWSGIFCVLIASQWTTIFGFLPGVGTILVSLMPIMFCVVGLAQVAQVSKLRAFFGAFVLPAILSIVTIFALMVGMMLIGALLF